MTDYKISLAAKLWLQGHDTWFIASQINPPYEGTRGNKYGGEAEVYNNLGKIRARAHEMMAEKARR